MNFIFLKCESHVIQNIPSQSLQKSKKNGTTSHANRCQNGAKSRSGGDLGSFWAALGGLFGVSWLQGISVPLPWCLLGSFSAVLEVSWAPLGRLLGRLGHQVGASWGVLRASWSVLSGFLRTKLFLSLTSDFDRFRD